MFNFSAILHKHVSLGRVAPVGNIFRIYAEKLSIYLLSSWMSTRDIEDYLQDIYGVEVSASLISRITDKIMTEISL